MLLQEWPIALIAHHPANISYLHQRRAAAFRPPTGQRLRWDGMHDGAGSTELTSIEEVLL
ncbi:hypothetical protein CR152_22145 [Massilia violaceinigra]|uniref:Uncharacterized protein n=1 Tax=Massilia violaceinigra TaxID=2045208 RepID=A0A2D2DPK7_9BURK|nr:hypothetical protein CR152_22145 [Massilia violaceinigra]